MLTQQKLKELFTYDPLTGIFVNKRLPHRRAGGIQLGGYRVISVAGEQFRAARLAYLYMTGEWPTEHVDHADRDTANDKWENLRSASRSQNMCNTKLRTDNSSGACGVSWNKRKQKWHVRVNVNGRLYHCGYFDSFDQAVLVRDMRAKTLHGAFVRLNQMETTI